jgi:AcrR family transcriptional regulator
VLLDRLVTLAIADADAAGLGAVAMRSLAERAGLPAHVLYRVVRDRDELYAAMAEHVIAGRMPARPSQQDSRAQLEQFARDAWAMYRRHPWLVAILATGRPPAGPAVLSIVDRPVEALTRAGYETAQAFAGYLTLDAYIQGMAMLIDRQDAGITYRTWRTSTLTRLENTGRTHRRPWLAAVTRSDPGRADADLDAWFDFGLRRLLDGLIPPSHDLPGQ